VVRGWLHTNQTLYFKRFTQFIYPLKPAGAIEADDVCRRVTDLKGKGFSLRREYPIGPENLDGEVVAAAVAAVSAGWKNLNLSLPELL